MIINRRDAEAQRRQNLNEFSAPLRLRGELLSNYPTGSSRAYCRINVFRPNFWNSIVARVC